MRRTVLLAVSVVLVVLQSCGAALALNAVDCEGGGVRGVGTDRPDRMMGTREIDALFGREGGDTLKGFGEGDALLGQRGDDKLDGGVGQDLLIGGADDDKLRGETALDIYYFERPDWGRDTIAEDSPSRNILRLPDGERFGGTVTTMSPDSGPLPEVRNAASGSTVNWKGEVVAVVIGSTGNDTITGNDAANHIFDGEGREGDRDTISGAGDATSWTCRTAPPTTRWSAAGVTTQSTSTRSSSWSPPGSARRRTPCRTTRRRRAMGYGAGVVPIGPSRDE